MVLNSTPSLQFGNTNSAITAPSYDAFNSSLGQQGFTGLNQGNSLGTQAFTGLNQGGAQAFTGLNQGGGNAGSNSIFDTLLSSQGAESAGTSQGFGLADGLNFGLGAAQTLIGMKYQEAALDQNQQALDLSQTKYTDLRNDKAALNAANQERAATAAKKISTYNNR